MKTRQDYLSGNCTHREYYGQFVTAGVKSRVTAHIGLEAIQQSADKNLNDIPLGKWDAVHKGAPPFEINSAMREAGDYPTAAGLVCIAKEAARQLMEVAK